MPDSALTILGLVVANSTLMFIAHNRHDRLSEQTNRIADELKAACVKRDKVSARSLKRQLESLTPRYRYALWAFILFGLGELMFFIAMVIYLQPPYWVAIVLLPSLLGLYFHILGDLWPASQATDLRTKDAQAEWQSKFGESQNCQY
jgi:hypothetical protein